MVTEQLKNMTRSEWIEKFNLYVEKETECIIDSELSSRGEIRWRSG